MNFDRRSHKPILREAMLPKALAVHGQCRSRKTSVDADDIGKHHRQVTENNAIDRESLFLRYRDLRRTSFDSCNGNLALDEKLLDGDS